MEKEIKDENRRKRLKTIDGNEIADRIRNNRRKEEENGNWNRKWRNQITENEIRDENRRKRLTVMK